MLNARIRKAWLNGANIGLIGDAAELTYDYTHMGNDRKALDDLTKHISARSRMRRRW